MLYYIILYYIIIYIYYVNALYRENNEHLPDLRAQFVRNMQLYTKRTQVFMYHSPKKSLSKLAGLKLARLCGFV